MVNPVSNPRAAGAGTPSPRSGALVLDARARQSLVAVRSLGRRGLRVAALEVSRAPPAFSSRWCNARFVCPGGYATEAYLGYLEEVLDETRAPLVIPSHDGTIALLRAHRTRVERRARIALAGEAAMAVAVNKARTLEVADRLGIRSPRSVLVAAPRDLPRALAEIGLPAVLKPCESWVGENGRSARLIPQLATTPAETCRVFADLTRLGGSVLYQELVMGRREAVSFLYADGEVHARFAQWAQRMVPPLGGDSVLRQSIPVPADIGEPAERLVRELDLQGYSEVEFRRGRDGRPVLMEINPRLSASVELAVRAGVDFPYLLKQWACGEPIDRVSGYRAGRWMRYLGGDVRTTREAFRQRGRPGIPSPGRAARDFVLAFFRPAGYDYFRWNDPLPAVHATAGFLRQSRCPFLKRDPSGLRRSHGRPGGKDGNAAVLSRRAV